LPHRDSSEASARNQPAQAGNCSAQIRRDDAEANLRRCDMKIPYRQAVDAVLALNLEYRFSAKQLMLLMRFMASLGEDELDLEAVNDAPREVWMGVLKCQSGTYVSHLFTALKEKGALTTSHKYQENGYRAYRSLHPDFAEAIRKHA